MLEETTHCPHQTHRNRTTSATETQAQTNNAAAGVRISRARRADNSEAESGEEEAVRKVVVTIN